MLHRYLVLLPLLVVACADDKDAPSCPSSPLCALSQPPTSPTGISDPSNVSNDPSNDEDSVSSTVDATEPSVTSSATDPTGSATLPETDPNPSNPSLPDTDPSSDPSTTNPSSDPSTTNPSSDPSTTNPSSDPSTTNPSGEESSTGGGGYGQCGWVPNSGYYGCPGEGAIPGTEDPNGAPIDCPGDPVEDAPCGSLDSIGCCSPQGENFYCNGQVVVRQECGV